MLKPKSPQASFYGSITYHPFGDRRNSQGDLATDRLFTGQRLDDTGLYYYGARYYDPIISGSKAVRNSQAGSRVSLS
ncbi:MAG: RHS repeat-associated core domain-containing protein [Dehalococcoidales bacterium]|nr:RHS repeat-associated core domain-containing protein [Dehalococcoidales bacterium]